MNPFYTKLLGLQEKNRPLG